MGLGRRNSPKGVGGGCSVGLQGVSVTRTYFKNPYSPYPLSPACKERGGDSLIMGRGQAPKGWLLLARCFSGGRILILPIAIRARLLIKAEAQPQAARTPINVQHADADMFAFPNDIARVQKTPLGKLRDVDQSF